MKKRIGYVELNINGEIIPVKFGIYALELFCKEYDVKIQDITSIFEATDKGTLPKDIIKFLAIAIRSGANYGAEIAGKGENYYSKFQVYEWLSEIGLNSEESSRIIFAFIKAIMNGGTFIEKQEEESEEPEKETKKKAMSSKT